MAELTWYVIYKTTHVETDEFYVGRHQTTNLNDGYQGSGNWVQSFEDRSVLVTEIVEYCENDDHLKERELHYINLWFDDPLCRNESLASDGGTIKGTPAHQRQLEYWSKPESRMKQSEKLAGRPQSEEHTQKLLESWTWERREASSALRQGVPLSKEHRDAIQQSWTEERRQELIAKQTGVPLPQATRDAIAEWWTPERRQAEAEKKRGRTHSPETLRKISAANLGKKLSEETRAAISATWNKERREEAAKKMAEVGRSGRGVSKSKEHRAAIAAAKAEYWLVTVITSGKEILVCNLKAWAKENGFNVTCLRDTASGRQKSHKGLLCRKITQEEYEQRSTNSPD